MAVSPSYKKWYENHKDSYNKRRRERYKADPSYRHKIQSSSRAHRQKSIAAKPVKSFYTIGEVATKINRNVQTIRTWEEKGYIPNAKGAMGYRIYTEHQIGLLLAFSLFIKTQAKSLPGYLDAVLTQSNQLKEQWHGSKN